MLEGACHCGAVTWTLEVGPDAATACNCSVCRRYGALWAYGYQGEGVRLTGAIRQYSWGDRSLAFGFCGDCGCVVCWQALAPNAQGRLRIAVNLRMAEPDEVADIPIRHFDGLCAFALVPGDDRTVRDYWF